MLFIIIIFFNMFSLCLSQTFHSNQKENNELKYVGFVVEEYDSINGCVI